MHHVIPKSVDPFFVNDDDDGSLFPHHEYCRIRGCAVFFLDRVQNSAVVFTCLTDCELR